MVVKKELDVVRPERAVNILVGKDDNTKEIHTRLEFGNVKDICRLSWTTTSL